MIEILGLYPMMGKDNLGNNQYRCNSQFVQKYWESGNHCENHGYLFLMFVNLVFTFFNQSLTCHCWCRILLYFLEKRMATKSIKSIITMAVIITYLKMDKELFVLYTNYSKVIMN
jgi:hypothetical protein